MNCPYCNKRIEGMTGLQEVTKFQKHLNSCKKNPNSLLRIDGAGNFEFKKVSLTEALEIRANSNQ